MPRKRIGAPILLTLIGVLICGSIWEYYITGKELTPEYIDLDKEVDLDKKYNSAYQLYKKTHLKKYPDCTQEQMLEADAKRHAQYEVDNYQHWQKIWGFGNESFYLTSKMIKIFNRRLPGFRPYHKKFSFYLSDDSIEMDFAKKVEEMNKLASDIRKLRGQMRHRKKRRLQIFANPIEKRIYDIQERVVGLIDQEPVEPEPEHTHKHSDELYKEDDSDVRTSE